MAEAIGSVSSTKRKRKVLTIEAKLAILNSLSKGISKASLAEEYGVGKSTISDIKNNEQKLKEYASHLDNQGVSQARKIMRLAKEDKLEEVPYAWFIQK